MKQNRKKTKSFVKESRRKWLDNAFTQEELERRAAYRNSPKIQLERFLDQLDAERARRRE